MTTELRELLYDTPVSNDGNASLELVEIIKRMQDAIEELRAQNAAMAAVTKPTGGATVDSEARTAIDAIIDGAGI